MYSEVKNIYKHTKPIHILPTPSQYLPTCRHFLCMYRYSFFAQLIRYLMAVHVMVNFSPCRPAGYNSKLCMHVNRDLVSCTHRSPTGLWSLALGQVGGIHAGPWLCKDMQASLCYFWQFSALIGFRFFMPDLLIGN